MTTGQRLVDISTLSTGTALNHFLNIDTGTGGGVTIICKDEVAGSLEKQYIMRGILDIEDDLQGELETLVEIKGSIQTDELKGILEENNNLKGKIECQ